MSSFDWVTNFISLVGRVKFVVVVVEVVVVGCG